MNLSDLTLIGWDILLEHTSYSYLIFSIPNAKQCPTKIALFFARAYHSIILSILRLLSSSKINWDNELNVFWPIIGTYCWNIINIFYRDFFNSIRVTVSDKITVFLARAYPMVRYSSNGVNNQRLFYPNPRTDRSEDGSRELRNDRKQYVGIVQRNQHQQKHMPRASLSQKKRLSPFKTNS